MSWGRRGRIEEMKKFGYLGYKVQKNGRQEEHERERIEMAATIMGQVWRIPVRWHTPCRGGGTRTMRLGAKSCLG